MNFIQDIWMKHTVSSLDLNIRPPKFHCRTFCSKPCKHKKLIMNHGLFTDGGPNRIYPLWTNKLYTIWGGSWTTAIYLWLEEIWKISAGEGHSWFHSNGKFVTVVEVANIYECSSKRKDPLSDDSCRGGDTVIMCSLTKKFPTFLLRIFWWNTKILLRNFWFFV